VRVVVWFLSESGSKDESFYRFWVSVLMAGFELKMATHSCAAIF